VAESPKTLVLLARDLQKAERVAQDLLVRSPQSSITVQAIDFSDPAQIQAWVDQVCTAGVPDIVLIAHGALPDQAACQQDLALSQSVLQINGISPVLFAESFVAHMEMANHGKLAIIGSVAGDRGRKSNYVYGAAKGLVARYAQGLQHRLAKTQIRVVLIKPGPTDTPMTTGLEKTVKITTFNYTREYLMHTCKHSPENADIIAGFIAGGVQSLVMNPTENLSTQMQIYKGKRHISTREAFRQIGINRLYNGWFACFARDAPFSAIYFATMNDSMRRLNRYPQFENTPASIKALIAGSVAAIPAAYLVTPFDVIKTRMQASGIRSYRYHIMDISEKFGIKGFFKGSLFRVARSTPQFGITMGTLSLLTNIELITS
jgi:short-subunit dehydrogenase